MYTKEFILQSLSLTVTAKDLLSMSLWEDFCNLRGINPYAISEGLMEEEEIIYLNSAEIKSLGIEIDLNL